jgi:hypothetical protein
MSVGCTAGPATPARGVDDSDSGDRERRVEELDDDGYPKFFTHIGPLSTSLLHFLTCSRLTFGDRSCATGTPISRRGQSSSENRQALLLSRWRSPTPWQSRPRPPCRGRRWRRGRAVAGPGRPRATTAGYGCRAGGARALAAERNRHLVGKVVEVLWDGHASRPAPPRRADGRRWSAGHGLRLALGGDRSVHGPAQRVGDRLPPRSSRPGRTMS